MPISKENFAGAGCLIIVTPIVAAVPFGPTMEVFAGNVLANSTKAQLSRTTEAPFACQDYAKALLFDVGRIFLAGAVTQLSGDIRLGLLVYTGIGMKQAIDTGFQVLDYVSANNSK